MKKYLNIVFVFAIAVCGTVNAQDNRVPAKGMAKFSKEGGFKEFEFTRRSVGDNDVLIEILYSGICHSDVHSSRGEWAFGARYPVVPGHEIVGKVTRVGKNVTKFKIGDYAGVGNVIHTCGKCDNCKSGQEQFCYNGVTFTYGAEDRYHDNEKMYGGYSSNYVIDERYAFTIPANADIKKIGPLMCAGITVYNPIQFSGVKKGDTIAVAGFGGLGHLAVKYAVAIGAKVTVFDITENKRKDALDMGAVSYVNVNKPDELKGLQDKFTFIISTIPAKYDPMLYVGMLKRNGDMAIVGQPASDQSPKIDVTSLPFFAHKKIYGSLIGGIALTQEAIDYSVKNNIYPDVEVITPNQLDTAFDKVVAGEVKFRYVLDVKSLKNK